MKNLRLILVLFFLGASQVLAFPQITDWKKNPTVVLENKKEVLLKKSQLLKLPFAVVTSDSDQLEFKINTFDKVLVYPNSKVQILDLAEDSGFVSDLYLLDGQIRFSSGHRGVDKTEEVVVIKTAFFDLKVSTVADFLIVLDMKIPSVEVKLIGGALPLEFFAYERKLTLSPGQSVKFIGELSDDKISIKYDYLLNSRKAPRGRLLDVQKFDQNIFIEKEKAMLKSEQQAKIEALKKVEDAKRKKKAFEDSFLCKKPFGQLNQCSWVMNNGKCYRQRCNVSGQWGGLTERPVKDCKRSEAAECDY